MRSQPLQIAIGLVSSLLLAFSLNVMHEASSASAIATVGGDDCPGQCGTRFTCPTECATGVYVEVTGTTENAAHHVNFNGSTPCRQHDNPACLTQAGSDDWTSCDKLLLCPE